MPPDENQPQNPTPTENPSPVSPQEPTEPASENTSNSELPEASQEPQKAQGEVFEPKVESEQLPENAINEQTAQENQVSIEPIPTPVSEPVEAPEPQTAQIPVNEPLAEPIINEPAKPVEENKTSLALGLLISARNAIQFRKRKKLDRIMSLFLQKSKITNDEVEKFLHVSDAT